MLIDSNYAMSEQNLRHLDEKVANKYEFRFDDDDDDEEIFQISY